MAEPITLPEAKLHLRIFHDDEDALITALIVAAREWVEHFTSHILVRREVVQRLDGFSRLNLFARPIASDAVLSITYLDSAGEEQAVTGGRLLFGSACALIAPAFGASWPVTFGPVTVAVEAGYAAPEDVPQSMKQAMLLLVGAWFENRSAVSDKPTSEVPFAVEALLRPYRPVLIG